MTRASSKCGFTLIELLVVIAIIAVPAATLLPARPAALGHSPVNTGGSNLTHISIALRVCYSEYAAYPPALATRNEAGFITDGGAPPSFHNSLLILQKRGESSRGGEGYDN